MRGWARCLAVLIWAVLGCNLTLPPPPVDSSLRIETVVANADLAVALAVASDGRVFYTEKETGRIRVIDANGQLLNTPFASVPVNTDAERGLLGIALHPEFAQNGFLYVYYTRLATLDNRVVRFEASGNVADGPETLIFTLPALPGPNHNGGNIHFGPDGKLYITIGDLFDQGNAQRIDTLAGKILRINDDGSIPNDNPFGAGNAVYALGLRNSFDFDFDPISGEIFASENGTNQHDELNLILRGDNYGWPNVEGNADGTTFTPQFGTLHDPIFDFSNGVVVPTGVAFVPDNTLGSGLQNKLLWSEYGTGRIMLFNLSADRTRITSQVVFAQGFNGGLTDLGFAPDGTLYVATTTSILHILPATQ
jgi:glucose/arabinose dehydrogenase